MKTQRYTISVSENGNGYAYTTDNPHGMFCLAEDVEKLETELKTEQELHKDADNRAKELWEGLIKIDKEANDILMSVEDRESEEWMSASNIRGEIEELLTKPPKQQKNHQVT